MDDAEGRRDMATRVHRVDPRQHVGKIKPYSTGASTNSRSTSRANRNARFGLAKSAPGCGVDEKLIARRSSSHLERVAPSERTVRPAR